MERSFYGTIREISRATHFVTLRGPTVAEDRWDWFWESLERNTDVLWLMAGVSTLYLGGATLLTWLMRKYYKKYRRYIEPSPLKIRLFQEIENAILDAEVALDNLAYDPTAVITRKLWLEHEERFIALQARVDMVEVQQYHLKQQRKLLTLRIQSSQYLLDVLHPDEDASDDAPDEGGLDIKTWTTQQLEQRRNSPSSVLQPIRSSQTETESEQSV